MLIDIRRCMLHVVRLNAFIHIGKVYVFTVSETAQLTLTAVLAAFSHDDAINGVLLHDESQQLLVSSVHGVAAFKLDTCMIFYRFYCHQESLICIPSDIKADYCL